MSVGRASSLEAATPTCASALVSTVTIDGRRRPPTSRPDGRIVVDGQLPEPEPWAVAGDLDLAVGGLHRHRAGRQLADGLGSEFGRDDGPALLEHLDLELGADRHLGVGAGHSQRATFDLAQDALEDRQGRPGADGSPGSGENVGKVISLGSDSHGCYPSSVCN